VPVPDTVTVLHLGDPGIEHGARNAVSCSTNKSLFIPLTFFLPELVQISKRSKFLNWNTF
jgi:hypothetical protein